MAEDCHEYDLREDNFSMSEVDFSLQDPAIGTCYANAVSMANDAWNLSHDYAEKLVKTSYLALASDYGISQDRSFRSNGLMYFESGKVESLLNLMKLRKSYCGTVEGESFLEQLTKDYLLKDLIIAGHLFKAYKQSITNGSSLSIEIEKDKKLKEAFSNISPSMIQTLEGLVNNIETRNSDLTPVQFIHEVIIANCSEFKKLKWNNVESFSFDDISTSKHRTNLKKSFINFFGKKSNPQPQIIGYCQNALMNSDMTVDTLFESHMDKYNASSFQKYCGGHASLVIGQKLVKGQCHVIVRDNFHCDEASAKKLKAKCTGKDILFKKDSLVSYITSITVITE